MNTISNFITFTIPLPSEAHQQAENFCSLQKNPQKSKQVYLNTLAVYAVDSYLKCMGFTTDLKNSESQDPVLLTLSNIADLKVKDLGRLECCPVLPNADFMEVPAEVWSDRIGYVAVRVNESLTEATLLGFVPNVHTKTISLERLQSLENFLFYLDDLPSSIVSLSHWFENLFTAGWEAIEDLIQPRTNDLAFNFRGVARTEIPWQVKRGKAISVNNQNLVLVIFLHEESPEKTNVLIQIYPQDEASYLPASLQLIILDESGNIFQEVTSRDKDDYIQVQIFGQPEEEFQVQLLLGEDAVTESFVL